jgi:periplasmic protein TonB
VNASAEALPISAAQEGHAPVRDRLTTTLFLAALFHGIVILGVTFAVPKSSDPPAPTLEILLQGPDPGQPDNPDAQYLSDRNQLGNGNTDKEGEPMNPASSLVPLEQAGVPDGNGSQYLDAKRGPKSVEVVSAKGNDSEVSLDSGNQTPAQRSETPLALASAAPSTIATDAVDESLRVYGEQDGRVEVIPNTRESKLAPYLDGWRRKVERMGSDNFPQFALKGGPPRVNPVLEVAIRADGTVDTVLVRRSSGRKELDQAAISILKRSSPFDPFPPSLSDAYDQLRFAYEWQFLEGGATRGKVSVSADQVRD